MSTSVRIVLIAFGVCASFAIIGTNLAKEIITARVAAVPVDDIVSVFVAIVVLDVSTALVVLRVEFAWLMDVDINSIVVGNIFFALSD